jgi:hypothetical protein
MPEVSVSYVPDRNRPDDLGLVHGWNHRYYRDQVKSQGIFAYDFSFRFRFAAAEALDYARNELIAAVRAEANRIRDESYTTLGLDYLWRDHEIGSFDAQAQQNILTQRSINGVNGAPDDAIKW